MSDETKRMVLCKRCLNAVAQGRYTARRTDANQPTRLRSCELCNTRTYCGTYDVGTERHPVVEHVNWQTRIKQVEYFHALKEE